MKQKQNREWEKSFQVYYLTYDNTATRQPPSPLPLQPSPSNYPKQQGPSHLATPMVFPHTPPLRKLEGPM